MHSYTLPTVNINIFPQYMFLRILRRALYLRKFDVGQNSNLNGTNRIDWYVRENLTTQKCLLVLDAQKFSYALTVYDADCSST